MVTCIRGAFYGLSACIVVTGLQDTVRVPYRVRNVHVLAPYGPLWIPYGHWDIRMFIFVGTVGPVRMQCGLGNTRTISGPGLAETRDVRQCTLGLYLPIQIPAPVAQLVECPLRGTGSHGFDPGPRHTKVVKMVLAAPCLALRLTG